MSLTHNTLTNKKKMNARIAEGSKNFATISQVVE